MTISEKLNEAHIRLGDALAEMDSWEDIYVELYKRGVTGKIGCPDSCIVANYLTAVTGDQVEVAMFNAFSPVGLVGAREPIPYSVRRFIRQFDDGMYPELVSEDN